MTLGRVDGLGGTAALVARIAAHIEKNISKCVHESLQKHAASLAYISNPATNTSSIESIFYDKVNTM